MRWGRRSIWRGNHCVCESLARVESTAAESVWVVSRDQQTRLRQRTSYLSKNKIWMQYEYSSSWVLCPPAAAVQGNGVVVDSRSQDTHRKFLGPSTFHRAGGEAVLDLQGAEEKAFLSIDVAIRWVAPFLRSRPPRGGAHRRCLRGQRPCEWTLRFPYRSCWWSESWELHAVPGRYDEGEGTPPRQPRWTYLSS